MYEEKYRIVLTDESGATVTSWTFDSKEGIPDIETIHETIKADLNWAAEETSGEVAGEEA